MELQTVFSNETAMIQANQEHRYIELEWFAHPESRIFRDIIVRSQQYAHEHQLTKWLCNLQQAEYLETEDQKWLVQAIFTAFDPQLQHDYAYLIRPVVPEVLTTYHINDLVQKEDRLKDRITVSIFMDVDQARQWLFTKTVKKPA